MTESSLHSRSTLPGGQDAISTSSSTLVNAEYDERKRDRTTPPRNGLRPSQSPQQKRPDALRSSHSSSSAQTARPGPVAHQRRKETDSMNAAGWSKLRPMRSNENGAVASFPDDHRCSDQEIEGGLCSCMRAIASGSGTSDDNGDSAQEHDDHHRAPSHSSDTSSSYHKRLLSARKRKIVLDQALADRESAAAHKPSSLRDDSFSSSRSTINRSKGTPVRQETSSPLSSASSRLRSLHNRSIRLTASDPVEVSSEDDMRKSNTNLRTSPMRSSIPHRRDTSPIRAPSSPARRDGLQSRPHTSSSAFDQGDFSAGRKAASSPTGPSAARKSISNIYEQLLREGEKKREEERERKEAARQRRRNERQRRENDSSLFARLTTSDRDSSLAQAAADESGEVDDEGMPPYTSPIFAVSPPSTRDATLMMTNNGQERASRQRASSHDLLHPLDAATPSASGAARIAALRALTSQHREEDALADASTASAPAQQEPSALAPAWSQMESSPIAPLPSSGKLSLSPRIASPTPSSTDSVLSFSFPNRPSPSASPQLLLSPRDAEMPRTAQSLSSPRCSGHRRGVNRDGAHAVLSMSARVPAADEAAAVALVETQLQSPVQAQAAATADAARRERDESVDSLNDLRPAADAAAPLSPSPGKHVKFSPNPPQISTFFPLPEEESEESSDDKGEEREQQEVQQNGFISRPAVPSESVIESKKINLDALRDHTDASFLSVEASRSLRGSPLKRTTASPRVPGSYASPAPNGALTSVGADSVTHAGPSDLLRAKAKGKQPQRGSSPPLVRRPPVLNLSQQEGPPRSRSWGSNLSLTDSSLNSSVDVKIVEENGGLKEEDDDEEEETDDFVTEEGSSMWMMAAPQQSTPPRRGRTPAVKAKPETAEEVTSSSQYDGDDSVRITLDKMKRLLRDEPKPIVDPAASSSEEKPTAQAALAAMDALTVIDEAVAASNGDATVLDQEYIRRIEAKRDQLTTIIKRYRVKPPPSVVRTSPQIRPLSLVWPVTLFAVAQVGLLALMMAAAHARSEQMYLFLHHGASSYAIPPHTFASLAGPLLMRWGIVPDVGQVVTDERVLTTGHSWLSLLRWTVVHVRQPVELVTAARTLLAKAAYSMGMYTLTVVPIGLSLPS